MNKVEKKLEYKRLVLAGQEKKAQQILEDLWEGNYDSKNSHNPIKKSKTSKPVKKKEKESLDSLTSINGIGNKTVKDVKRIYNSIDELKQALLEDKVPLRDDYVEKLNKYLRSK